MSSRLSPFRSACRRMVAAGALATALAASAPAQAIVVFDPTNYAQNVLTAARMLQSVNAQITGLQNQAQMLINQARNLASLPYSSLAPLQASIQQTQQLMAQAQRLAYDVTQIDQAFTRQYPQSYSAGTSSAQLTADAQERWKTALAGYQDALRVQAGVVQNLDSTRTQINALVGSSQSATGALESSQAGNQLLALQTRQLADLTALLAAQGRAASLDAARTSGDQAAAREQLRRFIDGGQGYQPAPVSLFH